MASSNKYVVDGFEFCAHVGMWYGDGISIDPDAAQLDNPRYIQALKTACIAYKFIQAMHLIEDFGDGWVEGATDIRRIHSESLNSILGWWQIMQESQCPIDPSPKSREIADIAISELSRRESLMRPAKAQRGADRPPGYVYVIKSPTGAYKIGRTIDPDNRLKTFSVKLPFEVEYLYVIPTCDPRGLEGELHNKFKDKRINGEWFSLDDDDLAFFGWLKEELMP